MLFVEAFCLTHVDGIYSLVQFFQGATNWSRIAPAVVETIPLQGMFARQSRATLEPFQGEFIGVEVALRARQFHHFTHVVNKTSGVPQAPTLVQMVQDEDGAAVGVGNVPQSIDNVTSIALNEINVHSRKASGETINGDKQRAVLPHVVLQLLHVGKAPALPEANGARF